MINIQLTIFGNYTLDLGYFTILEIALIRPDNKNIYNQEYISQRVMAPQALDIYLVRFTICLRLKYKKYNFF